MSSFIVEMNDLTSATLEKTEFLREECMQLEKEIIQRNQLLMDLIKKAQNTH